MDARSYVTPGVAAPFTGDMTQPLGKRIIQPYSKEWPQPYGQGGCIPCRKQQQMRYGHGPLGQGGKGYGKGIGSGYGKGTWGKPPYWAPTPGGGLAKQYPPGTVGIPYAFYPGYGLVQ